MRIPNSLRFLFARESETPEGTHPNDTQDSPGDTRTYGQRLADYHHVTPYEVWHRTTEQYYWKEQMRLAKKLNRLTSRLNRITIWGIVVTSLPLFFLWWTLDETRRQANIADQTLRVTRETMIHAERAWVAYNDLYGPGVTEEEKSTLTPVNNELRLRLELINVGNGPAMDVITSAGGWILPKDELSCHYKLRDESPKSVSVLPGRGIGHPLYSGVTVKDATDANIKAVNEGVKVLLIGGIVNYRDQFGMERKTLFCVTYNPKGRGLNFLYCPCGNKLE